MKLKRIVPIIMAVLLLSACSEKSMSQVIKEDIPFNVQEIIHKEKVKDGVIVLYTSHQRDNQGEFDVVTVAYLKGNDKNGWENAGNNHWEYYENDNMTVYSQVFYDYDKDGELENRIPLVYGEIHNLEIQTIEASGQEEKFKEAVIIEKESGRYYFKIGEFQIARGMSGEGKEIFRDKVKLQSVGVFFIPH